MVRIRARGYANNILVDLSKAHIAKTIYEEKASIDRARLWAAESWEIEPVRTHPYIKPVYAFLDAVIKNPRVLHRSKEWQLAQRNLPVMPEIPEQKEDQAATPRP